MALPDPEEVRMSLGDHLEELRKRLMWGLAGPLLFSIIALYYGTNILSWLLQPLQVAQNSLRQAPQSINTDLVAPFLLYIKLSFVTGLVVGVPWLFYQLWLFIAPGLYRHERKLVYRLIPGSVILSVIGVLFMRYVMLPVMIYFLIGFPLTIPVPDVRPNALERFLFDPPEYQTTEGVAPVRVPLLDKDPEGNKLGDLWVKVPENELRVNVGNEVVRARLAPPSAIVPFIDAVSYINLVLMLALAFAVAFQLPLVIWTLGKVGIFDHRQLRGARKYALFGCVVVAAILTPTADPVSLALLAVPLYGLYELGILLVRITPRDESEGIEET